MPRTSADPLNWAFLRSAVTARMVRGPLVPLSRLHPYAPTPSPPSVEEVRSSCRGRAAPPRGCCPPPPGRPAGVAAGGPCARGRFEKAAPPVETPPSVRTARHLTTACAGGRSQTAFEECQPFTTQPDESVGRSNPRVPPGRVTWTTLLAPTRHKNGCSRVESGYEPTAPLRDHCVWGIQVIEVRSGERQAALKS